MKIKTGALPLIMGSYAEKMGIDLLMYGHSAYTNGNEITIPRLDLQDNNGLELAHGYVAHECGHIRYSDFNLLKNFEYKNTIFGLFNALEDVRIDFLQVKNFPGLEKNFNFMFSQLAHENMSYLRKKLEQKELAPVLILYCDFFGHIDAGFNKSAIKALYKFSRKVLQCFLSDKIIDVIDSFIKGVASDKNSEAVFARVNKILKFLKRFITKFSSEFNKASQDEENRSQNIPDMFGDCSGENVPKIKKKISTAVVVKDLDLDAETKNFINEAMHDALNKALSIDFNASSDFKIPSLNDSYDSETKPSIGRRLEIMSENVTSGNDFGVTHGGKATPASNDKLFEKVSKDGSLRSKVEQLLIGYDEWVNGSSKKGQVISPRDFSLRRFNDYRVFKDHRIHNTMNTSVHLLIDVSGAMANPCRPNYPERRYEVANYAALSLALGLENVPHLNSEVTYFPGVSCEFETVKLLNDDVKSRARYFDQKPKGCTPLTQALLHAISNFPEKDTLQRNIIFVVTDGDPDNKETAMDVLRICEENDVEVYAVRIGCTGIPDIFPHSKTIVNADELPSAIFELFTEAFSRRREEKIIKIRK